jgi:hypothetical protein
MTPHYIMCIALSQTSKSNLKQNFKIFLVFYQGPRWIYSMKMNIDEKSRETVPLKKNYLLWNTLILQTSFN